MTNSLLIEQPRINAYGVELMKSTLAELFPTGTCPGRPSIGMSLEQATEQIGFWAESYLQKQSSSRRDDLHSKALALAERILRKTARDIGWCIAHQHGQEGLHQLEAAVLRNIKSTRDRDCIARHLDKTFDGIAGWMS